MDKSIATEQDGIEILYRGRRDISNIPFADPAQFNQFCNELEVDALLEKPEWSRDFNIPLGYRQLDVEQYVRSQIPEITNDSIIYDRVERELRMFKERELFPMLQLLIYIVDAMREHNIVWGVGRGSSVASYVLYLIGIHKIDSVRHGLDISEFLK